MRLRATTLRWSAAIMATITVSVLCAVALANHNPDHKLLKGKAPTQTVVVSSTDDTTIGPSDWTDIPGARTTIKVPSGEKALIVARFTAETVCYSTAPDHCSARILIGGKEGFPASGKDFHIDSNYGGETEESEKGHAMDRSRVVGSGDHVVKVQGAAMENMELRIDDWSLTVERIAR